MRCGHCKHEWHAWPAAMQEILEAPAHVDSVASATEEVRNFADDATAAAAFAAFEIPSVKKDKKPWYAPVLAFLPSRATPFVVAAPVLATVWLVLAFITYMPSWSKSDALSGVYAAVGATNMDGLTFSDITMEKEENEGKTRYIIAGHISNFGAEDRTIPSVRVELQNAKRDVLWGREYPTRKTLKAGEVYPFKISNVETSFGESVERIVVDMGNSMQLMVR